VLCSAVQCSAVQILASTLLSHGDLALSDEEAKRGGERSSVCKTCISRYAPHYSIIYYRAGPHKSALHRAVRVNQPTTA
jgi:hypothetical protein